MGSWFLFFSSLGLCLSLAFDVDLIGRTHNWLNANVKEKQDWAQQRIVNEHMSEELVTWDHRPSYRYDMTDWEETTQLLSLDITGLTIKELITKDLVLDYLKDNFSIKKIIN